MVIINACAAAIILSNNYVITVLITALLAAIIPIKKYLFYTKQNHNVRVHTLPIKHTFASAKTTAILAFEVVNFFL